MLILAQSLSVRVRVHRFPKIKRLKQKLENSQRWHRYFLGTWNRTPGEPTLKRQVDNMSGFLTLDTAS